VNPTDPPPDTTADRSGFVLLEVLTSLVIASLLILTVLNVIDQASNSLRTIPPDTLSENAVKRLLSTNQDVFVEQEDPESRRIMGRGGQWIVYQIEDPKSGQNLSVPVYLTTSDTAGLTKPAQENTTDT